MVVVVAAARGSLKYFLLIFFFVNQPNSLLHPSTLTPPENEKSQNFVMVNRKIGIYFMVFYEVLVATALRQNNLNSFVSFTQNGNRKISTRLLSLLLSAMSNVSRPTVTFCGIVITFDGNIIAVNAPLRGWVMCEFGCVWNDKIAGESNN